MLWGWEGEFRAAGIFFCYQIPCMNFETECKYGGPLGRTGPSCAKSRLVRPRLFPDVLVVTNGCTCTNPGRYLGSFSRWKRAPGIKMRRTSFLAEM